MASIGEEQEEIEVTPINIPAPIEQPTKQPERELEPVG